MGRIRLCAVDIDGTLLDKSNQIGDSAREAKRLCDELGVIFTISTGRVSTSAERFARELGIAFPVISNGGACIKVPFGEVLSLLPVPRHAVSRALSVARRHGVERYAYSRDQYVTETPGEHAEAYARGIGIPIGVAPDLMDYLSHEGAYSLVFRIDRNASDMSCRILSLSEELVLASHGEYRVNRTLPHLIEVLHPEATKGRALGRLAKMCGVSLDECLAIGDDFGDLDMLSAAGVGVLVANASSSICEGRTVMRGSYAEGVLEAVIRYVVLNKTE